MALAQLHTCHDSPCAGLPGDSITSYLHLLLNYLHSTLEQICFLTLFYKEKKKLSCLLFPLFKILIFSLLSLYLTRQSNYLSFLRSVFSLSRFSSQAQSHLNIGYAFYIFLPHTTRYGNCPGHSLCLHLIVSFQMTYRNFFVLHYITLQSTYFKFFCLFVFIAKVHSKCFECKISWVIDIDSDVEETEQCL